MAEQKSIYTMYGTKSFLNITSALDIDKVKFDFVALESQGKNHIACFLDVLEMAALMRDIESNILGKKLVESKNAAKAANKEYPDSVYTSPLGGTEKDGKAVSRHFTIAPGNKSEVIIQGFQQDAVKNKTGAYIPSKGSTVVRFSVGCAYRDLRKIAIIWSYIEKEYMAKAYSLEALRNPNIDNKAPNTRRRGEFKPTTPIAERRSQPGAYAFQGELNEQGGNNIVITKECASTVNGKDVITNGKAFKGEYYLGDENGRDVLYVTGINEVFS